MKLTLTQLRSVARPSGVFVGIALALALNGCSTAPKEKPVHQRAWIGGEYKKVRTLPEPLRAERKAAILVTALSSNTPARLAGVREGDLVLELNHKPMTKLKDFRAIIDHSEPGTTLPVKVHRNGESMDYQVVVGRETYRHWGTFMIAWPPIMKSPDLWPNPDFSLIALGYGTQHDRAELGSVESSYYRNCDAKNYHPWNGDWDFWLVIFRVAKSKEILSQEPVALTTALPVPAEWMLSAR
jgi:hypothetical protein